MDFGFGSLVVKCEEYFGKRVTGAGLAVVATAAVAVAADYLWLHIGRPAYELVAKTHLTAETVSLVGSYIMLAGLGCFAASEYLNAQRTRAKLAKVQELLDRSDAAFERAKQREGESAEILRVAHEQGATAELMLEAAVTVLRSQGTIGETQADDILSLLHRPPLLEQQPADPSPHPGGE